MAAPKEASYTPPLLELVTPCEKEAFASWPPGPKEAPSSHGRMGQLAARLPRELAPNVIALLGVAVVFQAWEFQHGKAESAWTAIAWVKAASVLSCWALHALAWGQALHTGSDAPLTELFQRACGLISAVFVVAVLCPTPPGGGLDFQWHLVQAVQLALLLVHHRAFVRATPAARVPSGPGTFLLLAACLVAIPHFLALLPQPIGDLAVGLGPARALYVALLCILAFQVFTGSSKKHAKTQKVLLLSLALRAVSRLLLLEVPGSMPVEHECVVKDGFVMAVLTSDLALAAMADRELHPFVAVLTAASLIPRLNVLALALVAFYYAAVFWDLSAYSGMPLFGVCRNVYCDGIYDMNHVGHKNAFRNAARLGNQLFVGVCGDEDANNYKRPPVMSAAEREAEVANCKCVTKVIQNAPCFGLTEEFIQKHRIHVVAMGKEYMDRFPNPDDDPYYKVPRRMGIAYPTPRTEGFSTSQLIQRILDRDASSMQKKSPT